MKKLILIGCFLLMGSNVFSNNIDNSRAVAQQRVQCIPLGVPLTITQEENYTIDELKMLRNSIFAQLGFKFKSQDVVDEMTRRGCLRSDLEFSADKLQTIDKKNVLILKGWEAGLEETNQALVFQMEWKKSASNPVARAKLLAESYCFLNDQTGKYFGIIHFGSGKSKTTHPLNGMMSVDRPTWAKGYSKYVTPSEKDAVAFTVKAKQDGFLYVFNRGSDGSLMQIYPNKKSGALRIRKDSALDLPRQADDELRISGPSGTNELLVMVSKLSRDHSGLPLRNEHGYFFFPTGPAAAALAAKHDGPLPWLAGKPKCPASGPCADEFGAAIASYNIVQ